MGLGGVAIAVLPSMIYPKQPFSDGLGGCFVVSTKLYTFAIRNQSPSNIQGDWLKYVEDHLISHNRFILVYNNVYIA